MRTRIYILCILCIALLSPAMQAQQKNRAVSRSTNEIFILRGSVLDTETMKPVNKVNVEVTGGAYTKTGRDGEFRIEAKIGDELVVKSEDFETVYYTVKDKQRIRIEVRPLEEAIALEQMQDVEEELVSYKTYLNEAQSVYRRDAAAGVDQVAKALAIEGLSSQERAESFKLLGDIYSFWKQYDLAITNYKLSIKNTPSTAVEIALAKAYYNNKSYQESIRLYKRLENKKLTPQQLVTVKEGLGDAYVATGDYVTSITNYEAVERTVSELNKVSEAARVRTKIGDAYDQQGAQQEAASNYNKAAQLSSLEKTESSVRAKTNIADYYSRNKSYDAEIELRKSAIEDLSVVAPDSISNDDVITTQKQNYKIGFALAAQNKYDESITFLNKSIEEAKRKEDLTVETNARRRLSEVYRDKGDIDKFKEAYEAYKEVVDLSYNRKEQEISQATRFAKDITEQQNRIISLEKDRQLNESRYQLAFQEQELVKARDTRQKVIIGSLILVTALLMLTAFAMYRSSKKQQYANNVLALKSLRSQMNPHFIFNALNSVNSFIATNDERTANRYLSDFSILMRAVLENSEEDFIPLSSEIDLIKRYTMLEHFRFQNRFDYEIEVDEELDVDAFMIPPMLLQPYVENAVWHGMRYKEEKGKLQITFAQKDEETAVITVSDDGVGRKRSKELKTENQKKQKSKGMGNIKKRIAILNEMYGDRISVAVSDIFENGEGTQVQLFIKKA
ncbi:histidine kinase [Dokdonia donghaensis]|uniref:histidine kinase n=1 Tax=Dokdonia donghaensis TaxID=326320 RepID=UPI0035C7A246